jgi:UDP-glucose 4-epimerase
MDVVTGGFGFIGNELVRQLRSERTVSILDNGTRMAPRIDDLAQVPSYDVDVTDFDAVCALFDRIKPEVVFHLAGLHYIPECNAFPEKTLRTNVEGTQAILRASALTRVKHVLVASSGAVYADSPNPLKESDTIAPVDIYGVSKRFTEELCQFHAEESGIPVTVLRLFNNYGPRETNPHIIPEILHQLRSGDILRLGNVKPRRDYIHTSDTAKALRLLSMHPPESYRVVNIASGQSACVEELVSLIGTILGREVSITTDSGRFRKSDKLIQTADISFLKELTQWTPEVDFQAGLKELLQFEGLLE